MCVTGNETGNETTKANTLNCKAALQRRHSGLQSCRTFAAGSKRDSAEPFGFELRSVRARGLAQEVRRKLQGGLNVFLLETVGKEARASLQVAYELPWVGRPLRGRLWLRPCSYAHARAYSFGARVPILYNMLCPVQGALEQQAERLVGK